MSDIMENEEFEKIIDNEDVPLYNDLSEEEILARQKEFANLSSEGKEMLKEITGIQNSRIITLNALMCNSIAVLKDADDNIEDIEFSEEYLKFISWYGSLIGHGQFYPRYEVHEKIFEDIMNSDLELEDDNNIFEYFRKKYIEKVRGVYKEIENPLSGLEEEASRRFEALSTTEKDLVEIFENIYKYKNMKWNEFEKIIK